MSSTTKIILAGLAVIIIAASAWLVAGRNGTSENNASEGDGQGAVQTIMYDESGFSPAVLTISAGQQVKFVNNADSEAEPASNPHPTHIDNPELNAGDIPPGQSQTITVTKTGTWTYHNHYQPDHQGSITVE